MSFCGDTSSQFDVKRLGHQLRRVFELMQDGEWRTLREISRATNDPEASVSARLRDLRKSRFGGFVVETRRRAPPGSGLWEYRLSVEDAEEERG